jgi:hypothetical protein
VLYTERQIPLPGILKKGGKDPEFLGSLRYLL